MPVPERKPLSARAELNVRAGTERSILMNEFWVPLGQDPDGGSVVYGDLRLMGDDQDNNEFNIGIGYRQMIGGVPLLGDGIAGVHGWVDRRITDFGSRFNQVTAGAEWMSDTLDLKLNTYLPLNEDKSYTIANPDPSSGFAGNQIVVSTDQTVVEEAMKGLDLELGWNALNIVEGFTDQDSGMDSARIYAGGYHFAGDKADNITGWRVRAAADVTPDLQLGARFQHDDVRGSQSFLEATIRFPFGQKKSQRSHGLYGRLDESPERDIDIVAAEAVTDPGGNVPLINSATGQAQNVIHVDNTSGGGDGTAENPFNTLAAAQAASSANDIIYVHRGDGTTAGQNAGITLNKTGQMLIGSGTNLTYDGARFTTANGAPVSTQTLIAATSSPLISNAGANAVTVAADNIYLAGFTARDSQNGIVIDANGTSAQNVTITDVSAINNDRMGIYLHGYNNGSLSAKVQRAITSSNGWHGMAIYDDTNATFDVDLGGGTLGSVGHNVLAGNTLEDLAVDYDGRALSAQNNWWGQSTGPDQDDPGVGIRPQIYYGAPINDGLVGHWTFDTEWTSNTTAYDRSGNDFDAGLGGSLSLLDMIAGEKRQALTFNGVDDYALINIPDPAGINLQAGATSLSVISTSYYLGGSALIVSKNGPLFHSMSARLGNSSYVVHTSPGGWGGAQGATPLVNGTSYDTATVYDGVNIRLYLDGNQDAIAAKANGISTPISCLVIGAGSPGGCGRTSFMHGAIDDVRIYNRALAAPEIFELHHMDTSSSVSFSGFLTSAP